LQIGETPAEQREYQEKVMIFRKLYFEEMAAYEKVRTFNQELISGSWEVGKLGSWEVGKLGRDSLGAMKI